MAKYGHCPSGRCGLKSEVRCSSAGWGASLSFGTVWIEIYDAGVLVGKQLSLSFGTVWIEISTGQVTD